MDCLHIQSKKLPKIEKSEEKCTQYFKKETWKNPSTLLATLLLLKFHLKMEH